jgi:FkbM family methyltransferase
MNIELATDLLLQSLLEKTDSQKNGAFVEIGLGNVNHSFLWAGKLGYKCYGVEPLPSADLLSLARLHDVDLTEAAISTSTGQLPIYIGNLDGWALSDISSLDPDWWGSGLESKMVSSLSLGDYFARKELERVACLKIDTEGSEFAVMSGLYNAHLKQLPQIVTFEYGGGGTKALSTGAWKPAFFERTLHCLEMIKRLGYTMALVVEQNANSVRFFELQSLPNFDAFFCCNAAVGNVICTQTYLSTEHRSKILKQMRPVLARDAVRNWFDGGRATMRHYFVRFVSGVKRRTPWA